MVIRRKSSIYKKLYEINGQKMMFGHDNIHFKTINLPAKQRYKNLCSKIHFKTINLPSKQRYKNLCSKFGLKKIKSSGKKNFQIININ